MTNADTDKLEKLMTTFKDEIKDEFRHQLGIQSENVQHKLDIVVEGHQMLSEKIDHVKTELSQRIECVERKLDSVAAKADDTATKLDAVIIKLDDVAADLKAHREDTEVHKKVYKVKEE